MNTYFCQGLLNESVIELLLTITWALLGIYLIRRLKFFETGAISRAFIVRMFIAKVLAGVALWYIYTYYYTDRRSADIYKYFDDAGVIHRVLFKNPVHYFQILLGINTDTPPVAAHLQDTWNWYKPHDTQVYNDNRSIIRFNCIVRLFSLGYYQVHSVVMNFICLCGLFALYKTFLPFFHRGKKWLFAAIFLAPSVMFWGSGVLKEGLLFFGIGLLLLSCFRMAEKGFSAGNALLAGMMLFILFICKYYIALALLPVMAAYIWVARTSGKKIWLKYALCLGLLPLGAGIAGRLSPANDPLVMLVRKQADFINLADSLQSGSRFEIPRLEPNLWNVAESVPYAIFRTFAKPHIFDASGAMMWMAALENAALCLMLLVSLFFADIRRMQWNVWFFCVGFVFTIYALIGLVTPVMGALVRYKTPALPFFAVALLLLIDMDKMAKFFSARFRR